MTTWTIPEIETERLRLRAPKLDDLPRLTDFWASARAEVLGGRRDAQGARRGMLSTFGAWALQGYGPWYIADKDSDQFLGWTGIFDGPDWAEPELGWTVMEEAEGRGIAFEAASAARLYLAQSLGLEGVISYIRADNTRSAALATRLGAKIEGDWTLMGIPVKVWRHPKAETA